MYCLIDRIVENADIRKKYDLASLIHLELKGLSIVEKTDLRTFLL